MRALITGSRGFAGTHLCRLLRERGVFVTGLDISARGSGGEDAFCSVDLTDVDALRAAVADADPDIVIHLATRFGAGGEAAAQEALGSNIRGTLVLGEALVARARPVRWVNVGSSAQYGAVPAPDEAVTEDAPQKPLGFYGWSKSAAEAIAMAHHGRNGVEVIPVRPFNHSGPGEPEHLVGSAFAHQIAAAEAGGEAVVHVGNLDAVRDLTDVRDLVRGYADLAERGTPGRVVNLCSGRATRVGDVLRMLLDRTTVALEVRADPARSRPAELARQVGSYALARRDIDWSPRITLEDSLGDLLDEWRTRLGAPRPPKPEKGTRA